MHLYDQETTDEDKFFAETSYAEYHEIKPKKKVDTPFERLKYSLCVNRQIKTILRRQKINAAIVYEPQGCYCIPFLKKNNIKVIYSERNTGEGVIQSRFLKKLVKQADVIVSNSFSAKETLKRGLKRPVTQINNGIITTDMEHINTVSCSDRTVILVPARIAPIKNQMLILEMLHGMEECSNFKVIFAGKIEDEQYATMLRDKIGEYSLENVCEMPGFVEDIKRLYSESDVVILPSFEEGMSNVVLECFANKKLILCSRIPMNLVNLEVEKFAFNPNDPSDLYDKFMKALEMSEEELKEYINTNFDFVCREHSIDNMVRSYIELVRK